MQWVLEKPPVIICAPFFRSSRSRLMATYKAPLREIEFVLNDVLKVEQPSNLPGLKRAITGPPNGPREQAQKPGGFYKGNPGPLARRVFMPRSCRRAI